MKRRTFLAGIAVALASFAVPRSRERLVFTTTGTTLLSVPRVIWFNRAGRRITEEPEVEEEDGRATFRIAEIETIESITVPARPAPDAPPPKFSIVTL